MEKSIKYFLDFISSSRMKSLYWRSGAMLVAGSLNIILQTLTEWNASSIITVIAGLVIGEITKHINKTNK